MQRNKRQRLNSPGREERRVRPTGDPANKPQITRACAECKKHKIKCFVQPGETSCLKCRKAGIQCIPHNFAQKFMDEDAAWKTEAAATIDRLKDAVEQLLQHNNLPGFNKYDGALSIVHAIPDCEHEQHGQKLSPLTTEYSSSAGQPGGNFESEGPSDGLRGHHDDSDLVPLPMNNLYNLTDPNSSQLIRVNPADVNGPDFISQGVLPISEAEFLFNHYRDNINPLLWDGILCSHRTLAAVRQSSSLMVAVVLTVAALHIPNREQSLHATYGAFVSLMRGSCLLRCQNLDVIRALCIGAFYLTSLSWAICSRAVRVATEMNLHKSSLQFARGSLESYERVRLWHVLYVCDHQFALAYGRPPLMHEDAAIRNADKILHSGLSSKGDHGLVAQVKLFRILANSYFMYGCDPDLELDGQDFGKLQEFNISVDQWRLEYQPKAVGLGDHSLLPPKTNTLYYHLARFQLNSVSLRGISGKEGVPATPNLDMSWDRQEASNVAIMAAMNTARLIVDDSELQKALIGLPIFTHAMIAVCASFLLKMAVVFGASSASGDAILYLPRDLAQYGLNFHTKTALTDVERLVRVLGQVADNASQRHVARQVVTGLSELLSRFSPGDEVDSFVYTLPGSKDVVQLPSNSLKRPWTSENDRVVQAHAGRTEQLSVHVPQSQLVEGLQADAGGQRQDPFDLTGDLDWRFDDGFLWGMDGMSSEVPYL
ncbi:unnamed protein product [Clonostachys solani]|uniref:Zn(2)-C6 fungal-type domain-containing protein n=1 Tax=Clonostachys solani TaxID=160281 RepID=A0A9N9YWF0_9HYPO|nr:unnamed protein product [Clonostachys solani]